MNYQERLLLELKEKLGASDYPTKTLADELHPAVFESIIQEAAKSGGITAGSILDAMIRGSFLLAGPMLARHGSIHLPA
ncbi:MAG: hypothetical protein HQM14_06695, partial [SAR324 cluster bacterium]|nr:hypothetical protein [SAR324 cluster bacterium]